MDTLQPEMSSSPSHLGTSVAAATPDTSDALYHRLKAASEKNQLSVVRELAAAGPPGRAALMQFLLEHKASVSAAPAGAGQSHLPGLIVAGTAYQVLFQAADPPAIEFLQAHFPTGVVPLRSESGVDYTLLQELLAKQEFEKADKLNNEKLCELAGAIASQRKWVYFTDVDRFSRTDLQTINALWLAHSEGKFGYSIQREIWLGTGKNWTKFWSKIHWKNGNAWTRYPQEFTWDLSAPRGHLPLSNQLRGVRVITTLFAHPAWT
jgi:GUN4-like/ARM-like repeat domain, GUN4-N terminal